jgi:hypothetical protein
MIRTYRTWDNYLEEAYSDDGTMALERLEAELLTYRTNDSDHAAEIPPPLSALTGFQM